ncbi:hypothetical protein IW261DRAFT_303918 [Armillaria novae-zelandiae]|uniref:Histidinol-phosphatase n=1 Tax=Armillaria novae-zelandiae TaxID=153914 RepID=A0AA39U425_9AGAR|nr:hypothetical protein IW261DRAFT_303918 [Armillaria novae-zelandiae]
MHSHHSHSGQFCKHTSGNLENVVLEAIHQGFAPYGLTEHVPRYQIQDLYPEEAGMPLADLEIQFNAFLDMNVNAARSKIHSIRHNGDWWNHTF